MKGKKLKITLWILGAIILVVGGPILINELYKLNRGYITIWGAPEVLGYYGTLLTAVGGILGIFFTGKHSQKQYREDARQRIMPFIATDFMVNSSCYEDFVQKLSLHPTMKNSEYKYFVITYSTDKGIEYPLYLSNEKRNLLARNGHYDVVDKATGGVSISHKLVRFYPCILKNVGAAVSLKTTFGLYKLENGKYTEKIDKRKTSKPLIIDKGEQIYVGLFFDLSDPAALGTYKFDIMYSDTSYTRYRRSITLEFSQNPETNAIEFQRTDTATHSIYSEKENKSNG